jgi:serine/threonine protein kinase
VNAARYQRLQEIFLHACALPRGERDGFLDEACRDEPDLRPEVETLLAHDEAPVAVVAGAAGGSGQALLARAISGDDEPPVELPARIGGYAVVRVIGEGGMGIVYEAEQEEPRRRVALKVIRPGMVTPPLLRRFRHEAQVLGQLEHPGIARIYEAGTEDRGEGGQAFFAMELIDGRPLLEEASAQRLGTRDRLELIARVCDALHHAHLKA